MVCHSNFSIKKASREDFPIILKFYKAGLKEIGLPYKESYLVDKIDKAFNCAPCFLLVINGIMRGMAGLTAGQNTHSGELTLCDYMVYVEPEHRSLKRLSGLINACKDFSKLHNMPLSMNFISKNDEKTRIRLLRMHGFRVHSITGVYNG